MCYDICMEKYVLDTNVFFNMEAGLDLGKTTKEVIANLSEFARTLRGEKGIEFLMPPRIVDEFLSFFDTPLESYVQDFLSLVTVKSPHTHSLTFSAQVFYELINEIRLRSYRGLQIGEEEIGKAAQAFIGTETLNKKDFQIKIGEHIRTFRDRYRNATRAGFLDSVADLDLIVLAKEVDGYVVSTDEGVIAWARMFGTKEMPLSTFRKRLTTA